MSTLQLISQAVFILGGGDVLAKRTFPVILDEQSYFIASPSIVVLPTGRILIAYERYCLLKARFLIDFER